MSLRENKLFGFAPYLALLFLFPLLILAYYAHPAADDFPISHTARDWGSYTTVVGYYKCWSARYTSLFLMSVNPLVFGGFKAYKLGAPIIIAGLFTSLLYFFSRLFRQSRLMFLYAAFFLSGFLLSMPDLTGGLYYLGGSLFYQPGNIILVLLLGSLIRNPPPQGFRGLGIGHWMSGAFQCMLLILLAGSNEIGMMLALAVPAIGFIFQWYVQRKPVFTWVLLLLISVLCAIIILKSPATFYRMEASGSFARSLPAVCLQAFQRMVQAIVVWISSPAILVFLILAYWIPGSGAAGFRPGKGWKIACIIASFLLLFVCFIPSFLGEGLLQGRTENTLLFLFLVLLILNFHVWNENGRQTALPIMPALLALFIFCLPFSSGFRLALRDLTSGEAAAYSAERDQRDSLMRATPGDTVRVEGLRHKPRSLFAGDIGDYPDPWYDNHFAALYGKKWIELKTKSARH